VRTALESLPWVRKAIVDYAKKQASVTVLSNGFDPLALEKVLTDAGFGGAVAKPNVEKKKKKTQPPTGSRVAFHVTGMKKTKSGAT